jgi:hypothetical protein
MIVPKRMLALLGCAARETARYAINGLHLESRGKKNRAVVTDGRMLIAVDWPVKPTGEKPFNVTLTGDSLRSISPMLGKKGEFVIRRGDAAHQDLSAQITMLPNKTSGTVSKCKSEFPPYADIFALQTKKECVRVLINPRFLVKVLLAMMEACEIERAEGKEIGVWLDVPSNPRSPVRITYDRPDDVAACAIIMPMAPQRDYVEFKV